MILCSTTNINHPKNHNYQCQNPTGTNEVENFVNA